jgi:hypothetical protein
MTFLEKFVIVQVVKNFLAVCNPLVEVIELPFDEDF